LHQDCKPTYDFLEALWRSRAISCLKMDLALYTLGSSPLKMQSFLMIQSDQQTRAIISK
jgi:hypothetical protein